jgi:LysR family transcriptional regulator, regulator for bpeEF and oprC
MNLFRAMRAYVEVVERGTFSRAAHALKITPAAVSTQIANLERHLDVSLLTRTTRHLHTTSEGAEYYKLCKRVLGELAEGEAALAKSKSTPRGVLRLDMYSQWAHQLIVPLLPEYFSRYPGIAIDLTDSGHLFDFNQMACDVMIRMAVTPIEDSGLVVRPMGYTRRAYAASPGYLARQGKPASPEELSKHRCIGYIDAISGRYWEWTFERGGKRMVVDTPHQFAASRSEVCIAAAMRGMGIFGCLSFDIKKQLRDGSLSLVLEDWSILAPPMYLLYPRNRQRSSLVKSFVDFILDKYPANAEIDPST